VSYFARLVSQSQLTVVGGAGPSDFAASSIDASRDASPDADVVEINDVVDAPLGVPHEYVAETSVPDVPNPSREVDFVSVEKPIAATPAASRDERADVVTAPTTFETHDLTPSTSMPMAGEVPTTSTYERAMQQVLRWVRAEPEPAQQREREFTLAVSSDGERHAENVEARAIEARVERSATARPIVAMPIELPRAIDPEAPAPRVSSRETASPRVSPSAPESVEVSIGTISVRIEAPTSEPVRPVSPAPAVRPAAGQAAAPPPASRASLRGSHGATCIREDAPLMTLSDSGRAIGAVTKLLREHLTRRGFSVNVGKPEVAAATNSTAKLNLFLYETGVDASLRNVELQTGLPTPLWITLKYLLTAFDDSESSDSADAHELLGRGLSALHELNFLSLDALVASDVRLALENNPEPLKITIDETPADLLSKVMQGTDEKYRLSMAFEVRPVMIVPDAPPSFPLLVGVDYTRTPPVVTGDGQSIAVLPSLGARLAAISPTSFDTGDVVTLTGDDLNLSGLECWLNGAQVSIIAQQTGQLKVRIEGEAHLPATEGPIAAGGAISAGELPILLRQRLVSGRYRASNVIVGRLRPTVSSAALNGAGTLTVNGLLLGTADDDVLIALSQSGAVIQLLESPPPPPAPVPPLSVVVGAGQKTLTVSGVGAAMTAGDYQVIVRINGQQARLSPTISV
jgi:hypothetical protein